MAVNAKDVAALRARTGAGMGDCKKALEESNGDIEVAIDLLRKKGISKAEKRAGRTAAEGQITTIVSADGACAAMVEVNSETDFVSRNDEFVALATSIGQHVFNDESITGTAEVAAAPAVLDRAWHLDSTQTLAEVVKLAAGKTGENISIRRVARFQAVGGVIGSYRHFNGKIAVLVELSGATGDAWVLQASAMRGHGAVQ